MSNTVEYCRIVCILGHFWAIFTCFLHYSTLTNKNTNNYSFWFDFYDLNQIIIRFDSSVFDIIRLFIANHVELFASFRFVSLRFASFYDSNHLFFDSFRFVSGYSLYVFDSGTNRITKTTIRPSLVLMLFNYLYSSGKSYPTWMSC